MSASRWPAMPTSQQVPDCSPESRAMHHRAATRAPCRCVSRMKLRSHAPALLQQRVAVEHAVTVRPVVAHSRLPRTEQPGIARPVRLLTRAGENGINARRYSMTCRPISVSTCRTPSSNSAAPCAPRICRNVSAIGKPGAAFHVMPARPRRGRCMRSAIRSTSSKQRGGSSPSASSKSCLYHRKSTVGCSGMAYSFLSNQLAAQIAS